MSSAVASADRGGLTTAMRCAVPNAAVTNFRFHDTRHMTATAQTRASSRSYPATAAAFRQTSSSPDKMLMLLAKIAVQPIQRT